MVTYPMFSSAERHAPDVNPKLRQKHASAFLCTFPLSTKLVGDGKSWPGYEKWMARGVIESVDED